MASTGLPVTAGSPPMGCQSLSCGERADAGWAAVRAPSCVVVATGIDSRAGGGTAGGAICAAGALGDCSGAGSSAIAWVAFAGRIPAWALGADCCEFGCGMIGLETLTVMI